MVDLGSRWGQLPPFTMKIQLWHPLFGKNSTPYLVPNCVLFSVFHFECGETYEQRLYSVQKPENFLEYSAKNVCAPLTCSIVFLVPPLQVAPPFNFCLDPPLEMFPDSTFASSYHIGWNAINNLAWCTYVCV